MGKLQLRSQKPIKGYRFKVTMRDTTGEVHDAVVPEGKEKAVGKLLDELASVLNPGVPVDTITVSVGNREDTRPNQAKEPEE